jgi:hypothetical protein
VRLSLRQFAVTDDALKQTDKPLRLCASASSAAHGEAHPQPWAIVDQTDQEFKAVLRDKLGAELIESIDQSIRTIQTCRI